MARFEFTLATADDEAEMRQVLARSEMEGRISLAFAREPNYFAASPVDGEFVQVIIGRDRAADRIVGLGMRAISPCFVNEQITSVGYLSGLRVLPEYRGRGGLVPRGYRYLKSLHQDGRAQFYLTTIAADNQTALATIASGRAGLPRYEPLGDYITLAINTSSVRTRVHDDGTVTTRLATDADRQPILELLQEHGPQRNFFPHYQPQDLFTGTGRLQGLKPSDVVLAFRGGRLVGTLGAWNQSAFKQVIVQHYSPWLTIGRPFYNWAAAWRGRPVLPRAGSTIAACYAALPVVADDDERVFNYLLVSVCREMARNGRKLLMLGLHERDPLLRLVRAWAGMEYVTRLFVVYWPDSTAAVDGLERRTPYLELGCL
jgi:hypothetical protein